jgi:cytochrome c oxidase subunit IV
VRTLAKTFLAVAAYLVAIATVYWFVTYEEAGTLLLIGAGLMVALVAAYLARRGALERHPSGPAAPEDDPEASPRGFAGSAVGSFPFSSAWPIVLVGGFVVTALGILFSVILLPIGVVLAGVAILGLMRESQA